MNAGERKWLNQMAEQVIGAAYEVSKIQSGGASHCLSVLTRVRPRLSAAK